MQLDLFGDNKMTKTTSVGIDFRVAGYGRLSPQEDVTPYEATLIAMLLTAVALQPNAVYTTFVAENKLGRHFVSVEG